MAILVIFLSYAYSPRGYEISGGSLTILRLIGNVQIGLDHVNEARAVKYRDLRWRVRIWGSGGLFGYYGLYYTAGLGKCTWYVTDRRKCVVVTTRDKTVLVSPDDVEGFVAAMRAFAPV